MAVTMGGLIARVYFLTLIVSVFSVDDSCIVNNFEGGSSGIFSEECLSVSKFEVKLYEDNPSIDNPNISTEYYLTLGEGTRSCISTDEEERISLGEDSKIVMYYYTKKGPSGSDPSCFFNIRGINNSPFSPTLETNADGWKEYFVSIKDEDDYVVTISCLSIPNDYTLAIDLIAFQITDEECYSTTTTTTDLSSTETTTDSTGESTTEESTTDESTTDESTTDESTTDESITNTKDSTTITETDDGVSTPVITDDPLNSTSSTTTTTQPPPTIDDSTWKSWKIIAISALVVAVIAIIMLTILLIIYCNRRKTEEHEEVEDPYVSITSDDDSKLPRMQLHRTVSTIGEPVVEIRRRRGSYSY